ncbi:MAG: hypothetical protein WA840_14420 [Caulobacteraceae bacterium]
MKLSQLGAFATAFATVSILVTPAGAQSNALGDTAERQASTTVSGVTVTARKITTVSELIVTAKKQCYVRRPDGMKTTPPKVVDIYPPHNAKIPAGVTFIRITFDQPMSKCGLVFTSVLNHASPSPASNLYGHMTADMKTFIMPNVTDKNMFYDIELNGKLWWTKNIFGEPADSYPIYFSTTAEVDNDPQHALLRDPNLTKIISQSDGPLIRLWIGEWLHPGATCCHLPKESREEPGGK